MEIKIVSNGPNLVIAPEREGQSIRVDANGEFQNVKIAADNQVEYVINDTILRSIKVVRDVQNETVEFFQERVNTVKNAIQVLLNFNPVTDTYSASDGTTTTTAADMHLDWWNVLKQDVRMTFADLLSFSTTANERWLNAVDDGANKIVQLASNPSNSFIFVPGVNSGIRTVENPDYTSMGDIQKLAESFNFNGKQTIFSHSAGTEATLRAIDQGARADFYVFASPRVRRSTFMEYLNRNNIRPEQVLVVTTTDDLPHWPTDLVSEPWNITSYNPVQIGANAWNSIFYDYENAQGKYNYLILSSDVTASTGQSPNLMGHGGMIAGAIQDHRYNGRYNGQDFTDKRLKEIYGDLVDD